MEEKEAAYKKRGVPRIVTIKGNELYYKDPQIKDELYTYRCRKKDCKYYIKIDKLNYDKILRKENEIQYEEFNSHSVHENKEGQLVENQKSNDIRTEKETKELAINLINANINENLEFHYKNFQQNKIRWNKGKISKLLYSLREIKFPKEEEFLNAINLIKIKLNDNDENEECFCPCKSEFINYRKKKRLEKYIIFMSEFQINFFGNVCELFIDGTFKVAPKNWYQVLNIFGYDKKQDFYMPLAFIILSSKSEEIYNEVFHKLVQLIKYHTNIKTFENIKIMSDFEIGLRRSIKSNFDFCILEGCYFHYCKAIWKKILKLNLFKKSLRYDTLIIFL